MANGNGKKKVVKQWKDSKGNVHVRYADGTKGISTGTRFSKGRAKVGGTQGPRAGERDKGGKKQLMMKMKKIEPIHRTSKPLHKTEFNK
tara:strand:- start:3144 stop:3410 length:267 start_codon:yes stop_codon:yes gene_type:complete